MFDHHTPTQISGSVTDIFAHRFVVETSDGRVLADLGPKGAAKAALRIGETVDLVGEMKPSELKVSRMVRNGETIDFEHAPKDRPHDDHAHVDPTPAIDALRGSGLTVIGQPRRKPKHFEILGRDNSGNFTEAHVELDGTIRKTKPIDRSADKWLTEIATAEAHV